MENSNTNGSNGKSELWNEIYETLAKLDLKESLEDQIDRPSACTEIENKVRECFTDAVEGSDFEYEYLVDNPRGVFEIGTWVPIAKSRIIRPENIPNYIQMGILRKFNR